MSSRFEMINKGSFSDAMIATSQKEIKINVLIRCVRTIKK